MQNSEELEKRIFLLNINLEAYKSNLIPEQIPDLSVLNNSLKNFVDNPRLVLSNVDELLSLLERIKAFLISVRMLDDLAVIEKAEILVEINSLIEEFKKMQTQNKVL